MGKDLSRKELQVMIENIKLSVQSNKRQTDQKIKDVEKVQQEIEDVGEELRVLFLEIETLLQNSENPKKKTEEAVLQIRKLVEGIKEQHQSTRDNIAMVSELRLEKMDMQERIQELERCRYLEVTQQLMQEID